MSCKEKKFTLSDGSVWSAQKLAEHMNMSQAAARARLKAHTDIDIVCRALNKQGLRLKCRKFTLSDGSVMDSTDCARRFNINASTMYARLSRGLRDVDVLSKKPSKVCKSGYSSGYVPIERQPKIIKEAIKQRPFFNPLSHIWMKMV
jgi:hypothetical protein